MRLPEHNFRQYLVAPGATPRTSRSPHIAEIIGGMSLDSASATFGRLVDTNDRTVGALPPAPHRPRRLVHAVVNAANSE